MQRCAWLNTNNEKYVQYHDKEWGVPVHDDTLLFEFLILEGAQAGLSWETILNKRHTYHAAFDAFDPKKVAQYDQAKQDALKQNPGIVRNRLKIASATKNAIAFLAIQKEFGSFKKYIWAFVDNTPIQNNFKTIAEIPAQTPLSIRISKDLKKRGMTFVGPTIIYAFLQAVGMVNDHTINCMCYTPLSIHKKLTQKKNNIK
jgi:DNA-3-methyladenine glycosylase I